MYKVQARLPVPSTRPTPQDFVSEEVPKLQAYVQRIGKLNPGFLSLGMSRQDVQRRIDAIVERESATDEGLDDALSEQLDRMAVEGKARLVDDPDAFASAALSKCRNAMENGSEVRSIVAQGDGGKPNATLSRSVHRSASVISLSMHMDHEEDYWFVQPEIMRDMLAHMVAIWSPDWVSAFPSMYVGASKQLFADRSPFGWMGYTATSDALGPDTPLARVEPMLEGTFLMLQDTVMTMSSSDIETCNRAEAFLADREVLPFL